MEATLDRFRSSTLGWLRGTMAGLGTILLALAGIVAASFGDWGLYPLLATAAALAIVLVEWVRNLAATFEVTDERLIIHRGIIFKSVDEIELYRVKDIRIDFTLLNQWANIGTILVSSSDETTRDGDLVLSHVENARDRREELRRLVDTARQRRRVREIDMIHDHDAL
jgi:uncharacterized membrane protein YdbT with pleckstrin-like domain